VYCVSDKFDKEKNMKRKKKYCSIPNKLGSKALNMNNPYSSRAVERRNFLRAQYGNTFPLKPNKS
jgi:hypothetical protein